MATRKRKSKKPKPLATLRGAFTAKIYRSKFKAFESTRYLDVKALKKARKVTVEIGSVEGGGVSVTLAAEIRNGIITKLKPVSCPGCEKPAPKKKRSTEESKAFHLKLVKRLREIGIPPPIVPKPLRSIEDLSDIDIGPITIFPDGRFDICITIIETDGTECMYCLFGPSSCMKLGPPE
jgi:hypothetical protein